jgi:hypothetical protein
MKDCPDDEGDGEWLILPVMIAVTVVVAWYWRLF